MLFSLLRKYDSFYANREGKIVVVIILWEPFLLYGKIEKTKGGCYGIW